MTKQPGMAIRTRASWRQALIWMDARARDAPSYTDCLSGQADVTISVRMETLTAARASPPVVACASTALPGRFVMPAAVATRTLQRALPLGEGFKALDRGDKTAAEQRFQQVLR